MIDRPTWLKPQTTSEANASMTAAVTIIVIARSAGIRRCNQSCSGQTSAMMKRPSVSDAKTTSA